MKKCTDCGGYELFGNSVVCHNNIGNQTNLYNINSIKITQSLLNVRNSCENLPEPTDGSFDDLFEEVIRYTKPSNRYLYISEDIINKVLETLIKYESESSEQNIEMAIDELCELEPSDIESLKYRDAEILSYKISC